MKNSGQLLKITVMMVKIVNASDREREPLLGKKSMNDSSTDSTSSLCRARRLPRVDFYLGDQGEDDSYESSMSSDNLLPSVFSDNLSTLFSKIKQLSSFNDLEKCKNIFKHVDVLNIPEDELSELRSILVESTDEQFFDFCMRQAYFPAPDQFEGFIKKLGCYNSGIFHGMQDGYFEEKPDITKDINAFIADKIPSSKFGHMMTLPSYC